MGLIRRVNNGEVKYYCANCGWDVTIYLTTWRGFLTLCPQCQEIFRFAHEAKYEIDEKGNRVKNPFDPVYYKYIEK